MKGLDANVLVRYLTLDDPVQSPLAIRFIESDEHIDVPLHVSVIVLCEVVWTLRSRYKYSKEQLVEILEKLLLTREIALESENEISQGLELYRTSSVGFADCLIVALSKAKSVTPTMTFDLNASKLDGFQLLQIETSPET